MILICDKCNEEYDEGLYPYCETYKCECGGDLSEEYELRCVDCSYEFRGSSGDMCEQCTGDTEEVD